MAEAEFRRNRVPAIRRRERLGTASPSFMRPIAEIRLSTTPIRCGNKLMNQFMTGNSGVDLSTFEIGETRLLFDPVFQRGKMP